MSQSVDVSHFTDVTLASEDTDDHDGHDDHDEYGDDKGKRSSIDKSHRKYMK